MTAISIIMPFYNRHGLVQESIESVTAQTFADFEVIVVDDGSTPPLERAHLGNGEHDPRIKVVRQENRGSAAARNAGLGLANGTYVLFLDSDDLLTPDALAALSSRLADGDLDAVVGNWLNFSAEGSGPSLRPEFHYADALANVVEGGWATGSALIKRSLDPVCSEAKSILPWDMADCYHRALRGTSARIAHVDRLIVKMRQDSGGRLTELYDHFEPMKAGTFWRESKVAFALNDERREAFDRQIFRYVFSLFHAGRLAEAKTLFAAVDAGRLTGYRWCRPMSPAWFARWFGVPAGLVLQRALSSIRARIGRA